MSQSTLKDKKRTRATKDLLKVLWSYIREFKKEISYISIIILFYTVVATLQPIIIQLAINEVLTDIDSGLILVLILIFGLLSILVWVFQSLNVWIVSTISSKLVQNIRNDTFTSLVNADMAYHHKNQSGNITARVVSDTQEIATGLTIFTNTSTELLLVFSTLLVLAYINIIFLVIALLGVPIAVYITKLFGKIGRNRMLSARQAYGKVSAKIAENLSGIAISKSFKQERRVSKDFEGYNQTAFSEVKRVMSISVLVAPTVALISTLLVYGVLISGGYLFSSSDLSFSIPILGTLIFPTGSQMSVDVIFLGIILIQRFLTP
ncbi:MAG: ABC transporter ATP-binding protein, partial [Candidatus Heimdallarchaeota archaeon]|nr:ABC transporter ATP-binding protein [Candidatus Heimdallarchaeota archaeon]